MKPFEIGEHLSGASQEPAADLVGWHSADQVNGNSQMVRERELTLRACAPSSMAVPVADNRIALMPDEIKIVSNDLADGLLESRQVGLFPGAELSHLGFTQVLHLVLGRIIDLVSQGPQQGRNFGAPALAQIRRIFN